MSTMMDQKDFPNRTSVTDLEMGLGPDETKTGRLGTDNKPKKTIIGVVLAIFTVMLIGAILWTASGTCEVARGPPGFGWAETLQEPEDTRTHYIANDVAELLRTAAQADDVEERLRRLKVAPTAAAGGAPGVVDHDEAAEEGCAAAAAAELDARADEEKAEPSPFSGPSRVMFRDRAGAPPGWFGHWCGCWDEEFDSDWGFEKRPEIILENLENEEENEKLKYGDS